MDRHRQVIEKTYSGVCKLYESRQIKDEITKITEEKRVLAAEFPCRLSFSTTTAKSKDGTFVQVQETKLFCSPENSIPSGSLLEITQDGRTGYYEKSGYPALYKSHQEVKLALKEAYTG